MTKMTRRRRRSPRSGPPTRELRLPVVRTDAARLAEIAQRSQLSYLAFLAEVLSAEVDERAERRRQRRISEARFPAPQAPGRLRPGGGTTSTRPPFAMLASCGYLDAGRARRRCSATAARESRIC